MKNPIQTGTMIALATATLFTAACGGKGESSASTTPMAKEQVAAIHCMGLNACKGQGSCKTAQNACKGQNSCKGQGFVDVATSDECTAGGGTVLADM
jgi:hypothetical protein